MKAAELLLELYTSKKDAQGKKIPNRRGYAEPSYGSQRASAWTDTGGHRIYNRQGIITGIAGDWLEEIGATTEDLAPAMKKARESEEYAKLLKIGFVEKTTKREEKNGTFLFTGKKGSLLGDEQGQAVWRRVLLSGRITSITSYSTGGKAPYTGRLKSAEPATAKTRADLSPVDRLVSNYTRAFDGIYKVQAPKFKAALLARLTKKKE